VIVPTYNERHNVPVLAERVQTALHGLDWELIFVDDDSPDGTYDAAAAIPDPRVRALRRTQNKGLAASVIDGVAEARGAWVAVMDGDLQHDPALLPAFLSTLQSGEVDVVVGSRFLRGGGAPGLSQARASASALTNAALRWTTGLRLTDPLSGYFATRRDDFTAARARLDGRGFKILLDLLLAWPGTPRVRELPITLSAREHGASKLAWRTAAELLLALAHHLRRRASDR
jgi:dolichol-phosphate mannosyltransferase